VELRFDIRASALPADVKARLADIAGKRLTGDGVLVIDSRESRTQAENREAARARLANLVELAFIRPRTRKATRPKKGAKERRLATKKIRADVKRARGNKPSADD
ncbi:MAG TPA: alternative ribosome rescue aminoacyl-tRNA hydrolase ArfB, partial [Vicinamibacterales bacterium]|nr:alternative ribosome rescue aminoacyl-tRNA hydrolase ArfB [Vicinamibacterales bacterium]